MTKQAQLITFAIDILYDRWRAELALDQEYGPTDVHNADLDADIARLAEITGIAADELKRRVFAPRSH